MDIQLKLIQKPSNYANPSHNSACAKSKTLVIGRDPSCGLILDCEEKVISRQHAHITKAGNKIILTDTSANGTFVNKQTEPLGYGNSIVLKNNDIIQLGEYALKINIKEKQAPKTAEITRLQPKNQKNCISSDKTRRAPSELTLVSKKQGEKTPAKSRNKPGLEKPQHKSSIGNINEAFTPPSITIPEDWDMTIELQKKSLGNPVPQNLKKPINFPEQEVALLSNLLKGLGISADKHDTDITADNMLALGRCLRVSIAGMIKHRDQADKIKSKLCFDDKNLLKSLNYSSFADFKTTDDFLQKLLSPEQKTHSEFVLEVIKCQNEIMEDQVAIYKSYNKAIDSFREELSPFTIESLFHEKQKGDKNIAEKLIPSIGKWEMYKKQWSEKCLNFKKIIKKNFEKNIRTLHQKRINERQVIKQKKK